MENSESKKFPWLAVIIIVLVVASGLQWWQTRSDDSSDLLKTTDLYSTSTSQNQALPENITDTSPAINNPSTKNFMHTITLETNKGTIVFETYDADAPKTSENFVTLAKKGYYDGIIFHRVIEGFMIQGGDPTGTGMGGASAWGGKFADELNPATESYKRGYVRGTVAMANSGPNTNGSQFFIMHKDNPLPNNYTIFGKVVKGIEVVDAIAAVPTDGNPPVGNSRPFVDVVIKKVTVSDK